MADWFKLSTSNAKNRGLSLARSKSNCEWSSRAKDPYTAYERWANP